MRLGVLQAYFSRADVGGGELHTERLGRALVARGHEVVVCTDTPADRRELDLPDGFTVREFDTPAKLNPVNELSLGRQARGVLEGCDAVLLTDESATVGVSCDVPTVMVFHLVWHGWLARHGLSGLAGKPQALAYAGLERRIVRGADRVVAISPNVREDIERAGCPPEKVVPIPNGVDVERFHPSAAPKADRFTVHFQGRLAPQKNPRLLVEAAARSEGDWRLTVGGTGTLEADLRNAIDEYGLSDRIEMLGYVPEADLPARYAASHVYALPSTYEGMPLAVLEAAASGTPAVVSPRAATDFVTGETGRIVDTDPAALAGALDHLSWDRAAVARMGERARERAVGYSWDRVAEEYEQLFREVAERARQPTGGGPA